MRPVGLLDLDAVARCLILVPEAARPDLARDIIARADAADRYRKRLGRRHALFGDGTLDAASVPYSAATRQCPIGRTYFEALTVIADALIEYRRF